jgi:hypothetical protein
MSKKDLKTTTGEDETISLALSRAMCVRLAELSERGA